MTDVVLVHTGIADARMWAPQLKSFAARHRVHAFDLPGFGSEPLEPGRLSYVDWVAERTPPGATVVGGSFGGRIALDLALEQPELVGRLVLVAPGLDGWKWSKEARAGFAEEEAARVRGDFGAAAEAQTRMWLADEADAAVRELVREMTVRTYELQLPVEDQVEVVWPKPPARERLGDVDVPTLIVVGDQDVPDMLEIAVLLERSIPGARKVVIEGAGHLPSLEQPDAFDRAVLLFLRG
ncbi:MAG: alpha/beta hydrolase [Actinobacteria bacterium]|nr:alpha/beta hydrolase [Actinomycetota bacterium]